MFKKPLSEEKIQLITKKIKNRFPETFKDIKERDKVKKQPRK